MLSVWSPDLLRFPICSKMVFAAEKPPRQVVAHVTVALMLRCSACSLVRRCRGVVRCRRRDLLVMSRPSADCLCMPRAEPVQGEILGEHLPRVDSQGNATAQLFDREGTISQVVL